MRKRFFASLLSLCMVVSLLPGTAFATGETASSGYGDNELPAGPDTTTNEWVVTPANAQYTLDGAYGDINGKTILFSAGSYGELELGRATKYAGSTTDYYIGGIATENKFNYADFVVKKNGTELNCTPFVRQV